MPMRFSGGLPVLAASMQHGGELASTQHGRELAAATHHTISLLSGSDRRLLPATYLTNIAAELAKLPLLHHYSSLLCPSKTDIHADQLSGFLAGNAFACGRDAALRIISGQSA